MTRGGRGGGWVGVRSSFIPSSPLLRTCRAGGGVEEAAEKRRAVNLLPRALRLQRKREKLERLAEARRARPLGPRRGSGRRNETQQNPKSHPPPPSHLAGEEQIVLLQPRGGSVREERSDLQPNLWDR